MHKPVADVVYIMIVRDENNLQYYYHLLVTPTQHAGKDCIAIVIICNLCSIIFKNVTLCFCV